MMTNADPVGQIFLFHPHTNYGFFFLLAINSTSYLIKGLTEVPELLLQIFINQCI